MVYAFIFLAIAKSPKVTSIKGPRLVIPVYAPMGLIAHVIGFMSKLSFQKVLLPRSEARLYSNTGIVKYSIV